MSATAAGSKRACTQTPLTVMSSGRPCWDAEERGNSMRKLAIALALSSTLLATPAFARDGAWYVGGEFGAMVVEDTDINIGGVEDPISLDPEYGYDGGLFVGYDLGGFRVEGEVAYKKADIEGFNTIIRLPAEPVNFPNQRLNTGGSTSALSFMLNGMLDFGDDDGISGFVGGGVGMARGQADNQGGFANPRPLPRARR